MLIKLKDGTVLGEVLNNGLRNLNFNCKDCGTSFTANVTEGATINPPIVESLAHCKCPLCHKEIWL